jgi:hypothetical protein
MGVGAWEQPPNVLVSILHTEFTSISWAFGLRNLQIPGNLLPLPLAGMPYDMARNVACQAALERNADALFFLDSDVVPPSDAILRLFNTRKPIISGMYCRRQPPWSVPVAQKGGNWLVDFKPGETVEVDLVGAGCLLIRTDVFRSLPAIDPARGKLWFDWRSDMPNLPHGDNTSEDFSFCRHAQRHGMKLLLDTSIVCRHVGLADSTFQHFRPAEIHTKT